MKEFESPLYDDLEENLEDEEELNEDEDEENTEIVSFVCEDCDYRWEDAYSEDEVDERSLVCPMCGSVNVTQL